MHLPSGHRGSFTFDPIDTRFHPFRQVRYCLLDVPICRGLVRVFPDRVLFVVVALAWLMTVVAMAQGNPQAALLKNPTAATPESLSEGKRLYLRYCASCHGANGEGGSGNDLIPAAPDLTDKEWKHGSTDGEIFSVIKNGVPPDLNMVPFGDQISDAGIWNVVNYVRSLSKKN